MRFATLGSGSAGNATLVEHDGTAILVDCGLSVRQVERRAAAIDFDIGTVSALFITHEHDDHIAGAAAFSRRTGVPVHVTRGTGIAAAARLEGVAAIEVFSPGQALQVGALSVHPIIVPHDAREPCQFVIAGGRRRLGILTDVGRVTTHLERSYDGLDGLILEFNHDPAMLAESPYPAVLKRRIGGEYGHLSNTQAESLLNRVDLNRLQHFVAAHLSEKTNTPEHVATCLARCLPQHVRHHIADQAAGSPWCEISA